jgi:CheY-like chemotaxis protein
MASILCVDDDRDGLAARKEVLERDGHKVWAVMSASDALETLRGQQIDVIVLDYYLNGIDGLTLGREIKKSRPLVPIIVLSGFAELPGEALGIAERWILKGGRPEKLLQAIRDVRPK